MTNYATVIYDKLSELSCDVYQERPEVIAELPTVTFSMTDSSAKFAMDGEELNQNEVVEIDIWANSSNESRVILDDIIALMLEIDFIYTTSRYIPDVDDRVYRLNCQFNF